jgi:hypothetical protein
MAQSGTGAPVAPGITKDLVPNTLIDETLAFVRRELAAWRDDPERPDQSAEEKLNLQLCKYLNVRARHDFPMAYFNHEEPQGPYRRIDLSVTPESVIVAGARTHTKYDPYLVMEGKRLPAPAKAREQEYVTGGQKITGGLQRFKMGLHGGGLDIGAMIAYVQNNKLDEWVKIINGWIGALHGSDCANGCKWSNDEALSSYDADEGNRTASCRSKVARISASTPDILIHHFWIAMKKKAATKRKAKKNPNGDQPS